MAKSNKKTRAGAARKPLTAEYSPLSFGEVYEEIQCLICEGWPKPFIYECLKWDAPEFATNETEGLIDLFCLGLVWHELGADLRNSLKQEGIWREGFWKEQ